MTVKLLVLQVAAPGVAASLRRPVEPLAVLSGEFVAIEAGPVPMAEPPPQDVRECGEMDCGSSWVVPPGLRFKGSRAAPGARPLRPRLPHLRLTAGLGFSGARRRTTAREMDMSSTGFHYGSMINSRDSLMMAAAIGERHSMPGGNT